LEGYELTDRGKIFITVVIVLLIFFIPAAILLYTAIANQPSMPPDDQGPQTSISPPPSITESPPPNGGGFNPPDIPPPNGGEDPGEPGANGQDPPRPPGSGQGSVNPTEGTLSFLFSPNIQDALDAETSSMLDEFLGSPKNTLDSIIAVETPQLTLEQSEAIVAAITGALSARGIQQSRIAYVTRPAVTEDDAFEVNMFYIIRRPK